MLGILGGLQTRLPLPGRAAAVAAAVALALVTTRAALAARAAALSLATARRLVVRQRRRGLDLLHARRQLRRGLQKRGRDVRCPARGHQDGGVPDEPREGRVLRCEQRGGISMHIQQLDGQIVHQ